MEKNWVVADRKFDDVIDQLLYNRGVFGKEDGGAIKEAKDHFLRPDFLRDSCNPFLLSGMKKATDRIVKAKESGQVVGIFADYDADGVPGAALLSRTLRQLGIKSYTFIPSREDGYGLSEDGIDHLAKKKCSLIITVDLGIRNVKEAEYCKRIGMDLIVTDHHEIPEILPSCYAVINPKKIGDKYPYKDLAGCGVVFKIVQALSEKYPNIIDQAFIKWNLDLAAISTIADVVSLTGENRVIAKWGLVVMKKTKNMGLAELIKVAGVVPEKIDAYAVGFQLAPRINAPGRIGHAAKSFELLIADQHEVAECLASDLDQKNTMRQQQMEKVGNEVLEKIEKDGQADDAIIVVSGDWPKGVIGPVASRISEKFSRPAILFSEDGSIFSGSARSLPGINIIKLIESSSKFLLRFGGHKGAAGLSLERGNYKSFVKTIKAEADRTIEKKHLVKTIAVDMDLAAKDISRSLCLNLCELEPFGQGNPKPLFRMVGVSLKGVRWIGKENDHAQLTIESDGDQLKGVYFKANKCHVGVESGKRYDIVFSLELDEWQGVSSVKLFIQDMKYYEK